MPFYQCIAPIGVITTGMKQEIVDEITRIHCAATRGLPRFVQIQSDEVNPENVFQDRKLSSAIRLHVRMRAGRPAENTTSDVDRLREPSEQGHGRSDRRHHDRHCRNVLRERHGVAPAFASAGRRRVIEGEIR